MYDSSRKKREGCYLVCIFVKINRTEIFWCLPLSLSQIQSDVMTICLPQRVACAASSHAWRLLLILKESLTKVYPCPYSVDLSLASLSTVSGGRGSMAGPHGFPLTFFDLSIYTYYIYRYIYSQHCVADFLSIDSL